MKTKMLACAALFMASTVAQAGLFDGLFGGDKESGSIVMKYADLVSTSDPQYQASELFAKRVNELTGGQATVQIYPNSQLGSSKEVTEGLKLGTVQIVKTTNAFFTPFFPEGKLLDLPYLFADRDQARRALDGEIGDHLREEAEKHGYKILWYFTPRARSVYSSRGPVSTPSEMKGLKVRVMNSPIMIDAINTMGGNAVPLPFGDVYSALEQGVVDAAENSVVSYSAMKHNEVTKYFSETNHFYSPEVVVMDLSYYNKLPEKVRAAMDSVIPEVVAFEAKLYEKQVSKLKQSLVQSGTKFNTVDMDAFRAKMAPLFEKHADDVGGMSLIKKAMNY